MSTKPLDSVLADARGELPVLRKHGQHVVADAIERLVDEVAESAAPFLTWISEADAQLQSGRSVVWLQRRFPQWERQGLARRHPQRPRMRQYLKVAIPQARNLDAVRADAAREAARQAS